MSEPKIKPCPFCGGDCFVERRDKAVKSRIVGWKTTYTYQVRCSARCTYGGITRSKEADAIAAHNSLYERARVGELVAEICGDDRAFLRVYPGHEGAGIGWLVKGNGKTADGATLLAALEQLAEKVRGA